MTRQPPFREVLEERISRITNNLIVQPRPWSLTPEHRTLKERMAHYNVPGLSLAIINNFQVERAAGFGLKEAGGSDPVQAETLFQAGSISKLVTALAALRLVEEGRLALDEDVNRFLTSWSVPPNAGWQPSVTLRQLLSHSAGTTVHGFVGYPRDEPLPTLAQVLDGEEPANSSPVYVNAVPGTQFRYSGGGTMIVQQLLEDVTGKPFPELMRQLVFEPLEMRHSTFEQPLPRELWNQAATGHLWVKNSPLSRKWYVFPEMAAAGLWTCACDLARVAVELQRAVAGWPGTIISQPTAREMLTPQVEEHVGLGPFLEGTGDSLRFSHDGDTLGFTARLLAYREHGLGAAIMVNAFVSERMMPELVKAIAHEYAWPGYIPADHTEVQVDPAILESYVGEYELRPGFTWVVSREGDKLAVRPTGQDAFPLFPASETMFFMRAADAEITFVREGDGSATGLILHQNGRELHAKRTTSE